MKFNINGTLNGDLNESEDADDGENSNKHEKICDNKSCSYCLQEVDDKWEKENVSTSFETKLVQAQETGTVSKLAEGTRRQRRKPANPQKSPLLGDPNFSGVTIYFQTVWHGQTCKLHMRHYYSRLPCQKMRKQRQSLIIDCEHDSCEPGGDCKYEAPEKDKLVLAGGKCCASCGTHRTPLWRDAEDGTSLCNACGIRCPQQISQVSSAVWSLLVHSSQRQ
ncbi:GATA-type zinc finger protein 1-like [Pomacea canaliculata]|uniref:GATA-type zinc finger protein 1-like n=1 Tax=Pomacea canaliculata TaxID=400727 RepID=UPI000D7383EE|nr:GATA-type zinc finger protein 1-like [Pomacea canaliculata]